MAVSVNFYNNGLKYCGDGTIDLGADVFKLVLLDADYVFDATDDTLSDVSGEEVSAGHGYSAGGITLGSVTWTANSGSPVFSCADIELTASGGDIGPIASAAVYSDSSTGDKLLFHINFGTTFTVVDGAGFRLNIDTTYGLFTLEN